VPDPDNTKFVPGIGQVITSEAAFSDFDEVSSSRLSDRQEPDQQPDDDVDETPDDGGNAEWSDKPWVRGQGEKYPHTVRDGPNITETLNLSVAADLERWNTIQAMAHHSAGPSLTITACERKFHAGSWFIYASHTKLSYQKL
jgi:hypothetical protein